LTSVNVLHSTQRNLSGGGDIAPLPEGWSKSAADKLVITLSANQRHLGFDKPPHAYLAGDDRLGISM